MSFSPSRWDAALFFVVVNTIRHPLAAKGLTEALTEAIRYRPKAGDRLEFAGTFGTAHRFGKAFGVRKPEPSTEFRKLARFCTFGTEYKRRQARLRRREAADAIKAGR